MAKEVLREVKALEKAVAVQSKPKDRDNAKKRKKKLIMNRTLPLEAKPDFIKDLKAQLNYGDIGYGVLLDKKV